MAACCECSAEIGAGGQAFSVCSPLGYACMCKACGERYGSADSVFHVLRRIVAEESSRSEPPRTWVGAAHLDRSV
jgi:hypothetical protein